MKKNIFDRIYKINRIICWASASRILSGVVFAAGDDWLSVPPQAGRQKSCPSC